MDDANSKLLALIPVKYLNTTRTADPERISTALLGQPYNNYLQLLPKEIFQLVLEFSRHV